MSSGKGSAAELLAFQRLAWVSITISVTRRCPLRCSHCITRSGPDLPDPVLSPETAHVWASDLPQLASLGLRHVSFTGGEPLLAVEAVTLLSRAASDAGLSSYVVTSGAWASTLAVARRIVGRLSHLTHWDIGYDAFHAEGLPRQRLENALAALSEAGATYTLRVCRSAGDREMDAFLQSIGSLIGENGTIVLQSTRALGRAEQSELGTERPARSPHLPMRPCVSTGLFVRADGSTGPCCSGLAYEQPANHPFHYNNASRPGGLIAAWRAWRGDQLLRLMRLTGLAALYDWVREAGAPANLQFSSDPCEACVSLWRDVPGASTTLARLARQPEVSMKLDALEEALYAEIWNETQAS